MPFSYCFKLTNSVTHINLPFPIEKAEKLKMNFCSYKTATAGQQLLMFKINHFDTNYYYDGTNLIKYTKILMLPPSASTPIIYENQTQHYDVDFDTASLKKGLASLRIEILIDGEFSADISVSNPIHIELTIS